MKRTDNDEQFCAIGNLVSTNTYTALDYVTFRDGSNKGMVMEKTSNLLYTQLIDLCKPENSSFYYKDHFLDGFLYRIFNYRMASYTDFTLPGALECRGIMFRMEGETPVKLVCRPPMKFFNLNENPYTMGLDHLKAIDFMDKADGSLISTFWHNGQLTLKTKASLTADQIKLAWDFLNKPENAVLKAELINFTSDIYTVNMEIVSPLNRVVLPYAKTGLKVLNVRQLNDGRSHYKAELSSVFKEYWVDSESIAKGDQEKFINSIAMMEDIEGFVIRYDTGQLVKVKTDWYKTLHHTKDSINIPRRLFECVVTETTDDLRSLFHDDPISLQAILDMEIMVIPKMNRMIRMVENFYEENKDKSRKDYAIAGQKALGEYFSLAMTMYLHNTGLKSDGPDYKAYAIKNYKHFGIPDIEAVEND